MPKLLTLRVSYLDSKIETLKVNNFQVCNEFRIALLCCRANISKLEAG